MKYKIGDILKLDPAWGFTGWTKDFLENLHPPFVVVIKKIHEYEIHYANSDIIEFGGYSYEYEEGGIRSHEDSVMKKIGELEPIYDRFEILDL